VNKQESEKIVEELEEGDRQDLLMYLAEIFDFRVLDAGEDVTYFLATDGNF
jgi:hypothetical protein